MTQSIGIAVHASSARTDHKFSGNPLPLHSSSYRFGSDKTQNFSLEQLRRGNHFTTVAVMTTTSALSANPTIPTDLTISKKSSIPGLTSGSLSFRDAAGNLICLLHGISSSRDAKLLKDASGNPLVSVLPHKGGGWQCFRGNSCEHKDLMFTGERTSHSRLRTVLEVFPVDQKWGSLQPDFRVQGSPFHRSCTIYRGNFILAQTSAMYKLGKAIVGRQKFRLTIYPGVDHTLVLALVVIFFGIS